MTTLHRRLLAAAVFACLPAAPGFAQGVESFYRGRTVAVVIGHQAGTGFDVYARTLIRHMPRHLPGKPVMVPQNMVGAVGLVAANWLNNVAPKDGSAFATFAPSNITENLLGAGRGKFDARKLTWIGNMDRSVAVCGVSKVSGFRTFEEMRQREVLVGASGSGVAGPLSQTARAVKNLLGVKMKVIQGYKGSSSIKLAIQKGEVQGICGLPLSTLQAEWKSDLDSGAFVPLLQMGIEKHPDLKGVAFAFDYAKTQEERQLFDLVFGLQSLGRPFAAPPGIPADRAKALREAFMATLADPQLLADAKKIRLAIKATSAAEMEKEIAAVYALPKPLVDRARAAIRNN
ncbi:MAG: Bug family tripartite tricarboxylate transporter substrate binding protein [Beijerinckiaceae bacterium]